MSEFTSETAQEFYLRSIKDQPDAEANIQLSQNRRFKKPLTANRASRESLEKNAPDVENFVSNPSALNNRLNVSNNKRAQLNTAQNWKSRKDSKETATGGPAVHSSQMTNKWADMSQVPDRVTRSDLSHLKLDN